MARIGKFTKQPDGSYHGCIVTLSVQHSDVKIVPSGLKHQSGQTTPPSHLVCAGEAEVGAGWTKQTDEGKTYLTLRIDDPSFTGAIYPSLFLQDDGSFDLIWSRAGRS